MDRRYRVDLTEEAQRELHDAHRWLAERNPSFADRWFDETIEAIKSLSYLPFRYRRMYERDDLPGEVRGFAQGRGRTVYRILYTIDEENGVVIVFEIRHAARAESSSIRED